jgi:hypothetical protein
MLSHIGDVLAIPFFFWLIVYFYNIPDKTLTEYILMVFSVAGFVMDIIFTWIYLTIRK